MREQFSRGENVMAWAREKFPERGNSPLTTQIAYDLQAGSYIQYAEENPKQKEKWASLLVEWLRPLLQEKDSLLEIGVGEATTLVAVTKALGNLQPVVYGFDASWSRSYLAQKYSNKQQISAQIFLADLFHIPLADSSIDVVYSSHSLEPNGGREREALQECLRVARKYLVLFEPIYELASEKAQERMRSHGYVRNLKEVAESLGATVTQYASLEWGVAELNPSGVIVLKKNASQSLEKPGDKKSIWQCPLTGEAMWDRSEFFSVPSTGLAYPFLKGVPLLSKDYAVIASVLG
jgi:ubiquinone/menaquinone biosynthesis C-methylase UbiE